MAESFKRNILGVEFNCRKVDNLNDLMNFINNTLLKTSNKNNESKFFFRGISRVDQIYCTLIRKFDSCMSKSFCEAHEIKMLMKLEKNGGEYFNNLSNVFDFVSTAQHFGLPTRMIDWTTNPYTALLFAVFMNSNPDDGVYRLMYIPQNKHIVLHDLPIDNKFIKSDVYVEKCYSMKFLSMIKCVEDLYNDDSKKEKIIESVYRNTNPLYLNKEIDISSIINICLNKFKEKRVLFVRPKFVNKRIAAQQGLFQFPASLDKIEILKQLSGTAKILEIDKSLRCQIIDKLERIGHNIYKIMPDLSSMCNAIFIKEQIDICTARINKN